MIYLPIDCDKPKCKKQTKSPRPIIIGNDWIPNLTETTSLAPPQSSNIDDPQTPVPEVADTIDVEHAVLLSILIGILVIGGCIFLVMMRPHIGYIEARQPTIGVGPNSNRRRQK